MNMSRDEVARKAGVGAGTVSRVYNRPHSVAEATRKRVLAAAEELGYQPNKAASRLRRKDNGTILVAMDRGQAFGGAWRNYSWLWATLDRALRERMESSPFEVKECVVNDGKHLQQIVASQPWVGLLTINFSCPDSMSHWVEAGLPCYAVSSHGIEDTEFAISPDEHAGGAMLAKHVKDCGNQVPLILTYPMHRLPQRRHRVEGFRSVFPHAKVWELETAPRHVPGFREELNRQIGAIEADVVFTHSSALGAEVMFALLEQGRRPGEDISLVTYDNAHWLSHLPVGLTSVDNRLHQIVGRAMDLMTEDISRSRSVQIASEKQLPELVTRASVVRR